MGHQEQGHPGGAEQHDDQEVPELVEELQRGRARRLFGEAIRAVLQQAQRRIGGIQAVRGTAVEFGGDPIRRGACQDGNEGCGFMCGFIGQSSR